RDAARADDERARGLEPRGVGRLPLADARRQPAHSPRAAVRAPRRHRLRPQDGAAFVVTLGGGALFSLAAVMLFARGGVATSILPLFASVAVEYQLLKRFARPKRVTKPPLAVEAELAYASASPSLPADVDNAAARVR